MHVWDKFLHTKIPNCLSQCRHLVLEIYAPNAGESLTTICIWNLQKLPLLKDRRTKLKLTVVYKCLNGMMVMPSNIFSQWASQVGTWDHMEAYLCISYLHTQIVTYIPPQLHVSQVLCPYGTNCLRTFTTVSPYLLLNPFINNFVLFFRVNFALAYAICSSYVYIS